MFNYKFLKVDIIGISIKEIIHPFDYDKIQLELALNLNTKSTYIINSEIKIILRFNCGILRRSGKLMSTPTYKVIYIFFFFNY